MDDAVTLMKMKTTADSVSKGKITGYTGDFTVNCRLGKVAVIIL